MPPVSVVHQQMRCGFCFAEDVSAEFIKIRDSLNRNLGVFNVALTRTYGNRHSSQLQDLRSELDKLQFAVSEEIRGMREELSFLVSACVEYAVACMQDATKDN